MDHHKLLIIVLANIHVENLVLILLLVMNYCDYIHIAQKLTLDFKKADYFSLCNNRCIQVFNY